jgi:hypothetical protein
MINRRILWRFNFLLKALSSVTLRKLKSVVAAEIQDHVEDWCRSLKSLVQARANECVPLAKLGYVGNDTFNHAAKSRGRLCWRRTSKYYRAVDSELEEQGVHGTWDMKGVRNHVFCRELHEMKCGQPV